MTALTTTVTCLSGCGVLGTGRTGDPPTRRVRVDWTRWDELDGIAERHTKGGHPTRSSTVPDRAAEPGPVPDTDTDTERTP